MAQQPDTRETPTGDGRDERVAGALTAQVSALLAEMARTPEVELDGGWHPDLRPGDALGRFTLSRELGRGGFGVVWEASDPELGRPVAIKVLRPGLRARGDAAGADLRREAEAVARLNHPCIVTLHDLGTGPTGAYLVFELLRGRRLDERLREGPLPRAEALRIGVKIARALAHAHAAGVVHRDLKPANVFLGGDGQVKVLDFGLAALFGRPGPSDAGTPAFMAPEQWRGEPGDARTDLFAFGVLLWTALAGEVPYPVRDGQPTVEAPGPAPEPPAAVRPRALRRLLRRLVAREPADRPAGAAEVRSELERLLAAETGRGRRRAVAALAGVAAAATLAAAWLSFTGPEPAAAGERLAVVVADADNRSGAPELDAVAGLLTAALEPSWRLQTLPRPRLLALARQAGLGEAPRLDAAVGRAVARLAGARVLVVPAVRREGAGWVVEVRASDPSDERPLLVVSESAADLAAVPAVVDRLAEAVRRKLRERRADLEAGRLDVAAALSPSVSAAHAYFTGLDCVARLALRFAMGPERCNHHFERALAHDPAFPLARYELASYLADTLQPEQAKPHLEAALRAVDRLPPREAGLVRALAAQIAGDGDGALRQAEAVLARFPDDATALTAAAEQQDFRGDWAGAIPYLRRLLELDPLSEGVLPPLVNAYGRLGRWDDLRALAARLAPLPASPGRAGAIARAQLWLGDGPAAVATARRAAAADPGPDAGHLLASMLEATGAWAEAEPLRRAAAEADPREPMGWWRLAGAVAAQGRAREAAALLERTRDLGDREAEATRAYVRASLSAGLPDGAGFWRDAARAAAVDPVTGGDFAVFLALRGDLPHAAELAARLPPGSLAAEEHTALLAWRGGDAGRALARLAAVEQRDPLALASGVEPSFLAAEVAAAAGDHREVLAAVARHRRLRQTGFWRAWTWGRTGLLAARAHLALGDAPAARAELDALHALWRRADPGLPGPAEARALLGGR